MEKVLSSIIATIIFLCVVACVICEYGTCYDFTIYYIDGSVEIIHCVDYSKRSNYLVLDDNYYIMFDSIEKYFIDETWCMQSCRRSCKC